MEQLIDDLSKAMGQLPVTAADDSSETPKPSKNLSDMPMNVVGLVIEKSDYKEQLILRRTSKTLLALVDKQQPSLTRLMVTCSHNRIVCVYNGRPVTYVSPTCDRENFSPASSDKIISETDYEQIAFNDLNSSLKNPKLQLEWFGFRIYDLSSEETNGMDNKRYDDYLEWKFRNTFGKIKNILESINHQLSVKVGRIDVFNYSNAMSILPYLKPGVLEIIVVGPDAEEWGLYSENIRQVSLLEQWKQAKALHFERGIDETFPTQYATHFKRFRIDEHHFFDHDKLIWIRDYILNHENAEICLISDHDGFVELTIENFGEIVGTPVSPNMSHYTVPNSKYYLEFMIEDKRITIEKKKKK